MVLFKMVLFNEKNKTVSEAMKDTKNHVTA